MDPLSRLLMFTLPQGRIVQNCTLSGEWSLPHASGAFLDLRWHAVLEGQAQLSMPSGQSCMLPALSVVLLPHNSAHRLQHQAHSRTRLLCGSLTFAEPAGYFLASLPEVLWLSPAEDSAEAHWLQAVLHWFATEAQQPQPGADALYSQQSATLLTLAIRQWLSQAPAGSELFAGLLHPRLGSVISSMLATPATPWTVELLARQACMSRASFAHLFRSVTGCTPLMLLTQIRMQTAARLLAGEGQGLAEIAEQVGYANESSLHKAFVRHFGYSPGEYRRRVTALASVSVL